MKYTLKDKYSKMKEIYPEFEKTINRKIKDLGKENVFSEYVKVKNGVTDYYDNLYISEFLFDVEDDDYYFVSPKNPLSFVLNISVLEGAEYDEFLRCVRDQLDDCTGFVSCCINIGGHDQNFNIPKEDIIKAG